MLVMAEKKAEKEESKKGYYMSERSYGSFLRSFTHGHALQLHAVHRRFLGELAARASSVICRTAETIDRFAHLASNRLRGSTGRTADEVRVQFNGAQVVVGHNTARSLAVPFGLGLVAGLIAGLALRSHLKRL